MVLIGQRAVRLLVHVMATDVGDAGRRTEALHLLAGGILRTVVRAVVLAVQ